MPLALSAFTHIWNAVGFAQSSARQWYLYSQSATCGRRGSDRGKNTFFSDHPYFGQIFLGTVFTLIGYPELGVPSVCMGSPLGLSIEMLYTIPRILMGLLAVADTFLIYKIVPERRYHGNVAFIASILFAATPLGWLFRRMYLDPIQLPFLLTSILFALYTGIRAKQRDQENSGRQNLEKKTKGRVIK